MSLNSADFSTITSKDGYSFVVESKLLPSKMSSALPYNSKIVETVIEYLHFRYMYQTVSLKKIPNFTIQPELALEVLKASIELGI